MMEGGRGLGEGVVIHHSQWRTRMEDFTVVAQSGEQVSPFRHSDRTGGNQPQRNTLCKLLFVKGCGRRGSETFYFTLRASWTNFLNGLQETFPVSSPGSKLEGALRILARCMFPGPGRTILPLLRSITHIHELSCESGENSRGCGGSAPSCGTVCCETRAVGAEERQATGIKDKGDINTHREGLRKN